jgi:hypothetical protein
VGWWCHVDDERKENSVVAVQVPVVLVERGVLGANGEGERRVVESRSSARRAGLRRGMVDAGIGIYDIVV